MVNAAAGLDELAGAQPAAAARARAAPPGECAAADGPPA
jgi:hypothetical protein